VANLCEIIVVDNGSDNLGEIEELLKRFPNSRLIELGANYGLYAAANAGIEKAKGADWVLFLNPDSRVLCDPAEVVGIAPQEGTGAIALSPDTRRSEEKFEAVDLNMSNGMLVKATLLEQGLKYDESFFIDQGDFEFSWQIRHMGKRILVTNARCLDHVLGIRRKFLGYYSYEPAWRLYFIGKDSTRLFLTRKLSFRKWVGQLIYFYLVAIISGNGLDPWAISRGLYDGLFKRRSDLSLIRRLAHAEGKSLGDLRMKYRCSKRAYPQQNEMLCVCNSLILRIGAQRLSLARSMRQQITIGTKKWQRPCALTAVAHPRRQPCQDPLVMKG